MTNVSRLACSICKKCPFFYVRSTGVESQGFSCFPGLLIFLVGNLNDILGPTMRKLSRVLLFALVLGFVAPVSADWQQAKR